MKDKEKGIEEFLKKIVKLNPFEIIGVAKILGVSVFKDEEMKDPLPFEEVLGKMVAQYGMLSRPRRRNLNKLLHAATKGRG